MAGFRSESAAPELADQLHALAQQLAELDPATAEAGRLVIDSTQPPRRTGQLAASLTARPTGDGVVFGSTARYWTFVHWGAPARNIRARPFFTEQLARSTDEVAAVYLAHATAALNRIG